MLPQTPTLKQNVMNIHIQFWGVAARLAGTERRELALPEAATVADAAAVLAGSTELARELKRCAFAIGDDLVPRSHTLKNGDTLAVLPPVSGG